MTFSRLIAISLLSLYSTLGFAKDGIVGSVVNAIQSMPKSAPTAGTIEYAFSPGKGAQGLVLKTIASASREILVLAYSFTSKPIAEALLNAHRRGIDVRVVVDKSQLGERYTAATFLANSGVSVRVDSEHAIQHSKVLIVDRQTVQTGSFNYTASAVDRNAENVLVLWGNEQLAQGYVNDWADHWNHGATFPAKY